ncbi:MAG: PUA-like domain [Acidobacteriales bacterium]|nr:PUA-like domain [Terriglobales bacterium]
MAVIKAISLWQIWAAAMEHAKKRIETRSWPTSYRGPLAIHAAKKPFNARDYSSEFASQVRKDGLLDERLQYGAVVCIVELVACVPTNSIRRTLSQTELMYGNYGDGRWAWVTQNLVRLPAAIPTRGFQGLFDFTLPEWMENTYRDSARPSPQGQLVF